MKLASLILLVLLSGCIFDLQGIGTDEPAISKDKVARNLFIEGKRLFNLRDFTGARREFHKIIEDYRGDSLLHETQWMIARSLSEISPEYLLTSSEEGIGMISRFNFGRYSL